MFIVHAHHQPNFYAQFKSPKKPTFTNYLNARQIQNLLKNIQLFLKLHI